MEEKRTPVSPSPSHSLAPSSTKRLSLPKKLHLRAETDFKKVFDARTRGTAGPLAFHARPNDLAISRFGMSVSRKVGTAVLRNRIRRRLRESFRLLQHDLPKGYDIVVVVRPHAPLELIDYQRLLRGSLQKLDATWKRRATKRPESPAANG